MVLISTTSGWRTGSLQRSLVLEKRLSPATPAQAPGISTLIYVLGGNQESLLPRFREAADLYRRGVARKIHILSRPGITEYSEDLGRNFTNDEWATRELVALKVAKGDVVPVSVAPSFFGTLSEADRISEMVRKEGYKRLILVSSSHHTKRLYRTFNSFLSGFPVEIYVYGAGDCKEWKELLSEYIKYVIYDYVILPIRGLGKQYNSKVAGHVAETIE